MQHYKYPGLVILVIFIASCGPGRQLSELQTNAEEAYRQENYEAALGYYQGLIELKTSRGNDVSGATYYSAGISAWETGNTPRAIEYLRLAHRNEFATERSYYTLSLAYREIDNLSLEISNLEGYVENYPDGEWIDESRKRLFETYIESNNYDGAMELWPLIGNQASRDPELLEGYFVLNRELGNEEELEDIAERLIDLDKNNKQALEYLAEKYFWAAENRYQREMKAYENEQTRSQYRQLLNALDQINESFRISRDYFERLYELEPAPRFARYLMNVYIRFGNQERAEFYRKRAN
jgi:hypothetical protein